MARAWKIGTLLAMTSAVAGCGLVPKSQMEECRTYSRSLQAANAELKDSVETLRSSNRDLRDRAVDDEQRIASLEELKVRLESSVSSYQDERDRLAATFERFKSQIRTGTPTIPTAMLDRFDAFVKSHPGCEFDPVSRVLAIPALAFFEKGDATLRPEAAPLLKELRQLVLMAHEAEFKLIVACRGEAPSPIQRTSHEPDGSGRKPLALKQALQIEKALTGEGGPEGSRVSVVMEEGPTPGEKPTAVDSR